ncbi:MAG: hypothetical protein Q9217_000688 [Psora testacea]
MPMALTPALADASKHGTNCFLYDQFMERTHGTVVDTAHLMAYIPSYIFPQEEHKISNNMVCGVSLGGHAAWQCLVNLPAITAAISIVGCPDYIRLMMDRARLSKLATYEDSSPPGSSFLGSQDFPRALVDAVESYDPAGSILCRISANTDIFDRDVTATEKQILLPKMQRSFQNKRMLNMSGGADKLVAYHCSQPFLQWLKRAIAPCGWFSDGDFLLQDIVFEGLGHEMSTDMARKLDAFVIETLTKSYPPYGGSKPSNL